MLVCACMEMIEYCPSYAHARRQKIMGFLCILKMCYHVSTALSSHDNLSQDVVMVSTQDLKMLSCLHVLPICCCHVDTGSQDVVVMLTQALKMLLSC